MAMFARHDIEPLHWFQTYYMNSDSAAPAMSYCNALQQEKPDESVCTDQNKTRYDPFNAAVEGQETTYGDFRYKTHAENGGKAINQGHGTIKILTSLPEPDNRYGRDIKNGYKLSSVGYKRLKPNSDSTPDNPSGNPKTKGEWSKHYNDKYGQLCITWINGREIGNTYKWESGGKGKKGKWVEWTPGEKKIHKRYVSNAGFPLLRREAQSDGVKFNDSLHFPPGTAAKGDQGHESETSSSNPDEPALNLAGIPRLTDEFFDPPSTGKEVSVDDILSSGSHQGEEEIDVAKRATTGPKQGQMITIPPWSHMADKDTGMISVKWVRRNLGITDPTRDWVDDIWVF
jgi:hypothetical protein